jgi:hypothetical protein
MRLIIRICSRSWGRRERGLRTFCSEMDCTTVYMESVYLRLPGENNGEATFCVPFFPVTKTVISHGFFRNSGT